MSYDKCCHCDATENLIPVTDEDWVCPDCLELFYEQCEECEEYWEIGVIDLVEAPDGRMVCPYCLEDLV